MLGIAAVVYPIGVKKENVSWTHQRNLGYIRDACPLPELQRKVPGTVWMIFGNLQTQRQELHHPTLVDLHELSLLSRKDQRRWRTEIHKTKMTVRTHFAIEHGRD